MKNSEENLKKIIKKWKFRTIVFFILFHICVLYISTSIIGKKKISKMDIKGAAKLSGIKYTSKEIDLMMDDVVENLKSYIKIRENSIDNNISPQLFFKPLITDYHLREKNKLQTVSFQSPLIDRPENIEDLAFASIETLAFLIKNKKISSLELTEMYLDRLKKYGTKLECVITITRDLALDLAKKADKEIQKGDYKGPLHGIPWGAKDLIATKGIKTTWGAAPYKNQIPDYNATIVEKITQAGGVLVAKLTTGALAWGDVWYGGKTRNPWDVKQGSSGSSAGPASATSAGLVGFSIGTETWGSIISPSTRCGVTGLRPTYGLVSKYGIMALSWSMDKAGPICRTVNGCGFVLKEIMGKDPKDLSTYNAPFNWSGSADIKSIRVGYLKDAFEKDYKNKERDSFILKKLEEKGINLIPVKLPDFPVDALSFILNAEAATAFEELSRGDMDDEMVSQIRYAWPNVFRFGRLIPAVEYIKANRLRVVLMEQMNRLLKEVDVYLTPSFGNSNLLLTNLTGHPSLVLPNGFDEKNHPGSITITGDLLKETEILVLGDAIQRITDFHKKYPTLK